MRLTWQATRDSQDPPAQAAMRHSSIDLTMNVYTDPQLLDVAGALDALPELPLDASRCVNQPQLRPTGTDQARR